MISNQKNSMFPIRQEKGHSGVWKGHEKAFQVSMGKSNWLKGWLENLLTKSMKVRCFFKHKIIPVCYKVIVILNCYIKTIHY